MQWRPNVPILIQKKDRTLFEPRKLSIDNKYHMPGMRS